MSNPVDPRRTTVAHDPHSSAASDRDETAATSPSPNALNGPGFGPPAVPGEVGVLGPYCILKELGKGVAWVPCIWPSTPVSTGSSR
jgi:hypothetical protein